MTSTIRSGKQSLAPLLDLKERKLTAVEKVNINTETSKGLEKKLGISPALAKKIIGARKRRHFNSADDLTSALGVDSRKLAQHSNKIIFQFVDQVEVLDVKIADDRIFSFKPFNLVVRFLSPSRGKAVLASVTVHWRGNPFVVQQLISEVEGKAGSINLILNEKFALPPGLVRLHVALYDNLGGADNFELQEWVYPSNPFSLFLSPRNRSIYNGSIRPDWDGTNWHTGLNIRFVNGDNATVTLHRNVVWKFWDGGVGGTLVESGNFNWSEAVVVGPYGTYSGWISFFSPPGSNIFKRYENKEDMSIEIIFRKSNNTEVKATITCRIMAGFGINIILVGDYSDTERQTIANGINDARDVYENHGLTFSSVQWWSISNAQAGGYTILNDHDEWEDLLDDWTVNNNSVDCFVTRGLWANYAGWSPIPGPDEKDGSCEDDGLAVDNSLQCFAHELGHYMGGLDHSDGEGRGNVMHSVCGGRNFTYDQYKEFFDHDWTRIVR